MIYVTGRKDKLTAACFKSLKIEKYQSAKDKEISIYYDNGH